MSENLSNVCTSVPWLPGFGSRIFAPGPRHVSASLSSADTHQLNALWGMEIALGVEVGPVGIAQEGVRMVAPIVLALRADD